MAITTGKGTVMQIASALTSPFSSANIGQVRTITGPTTKPKIVDITAHDTPGFWAAKLAVLIEAGDISFEVNFNKADATHSYTAGMWYYMINLLQCGLRVIFPNAAGQLTMDAYVGQHEFTAPVDNVLAAKIQFAINGAIAAV